MKNLSAPLPTTISLIALSLATAWPASAQDGSERVVQRTPESAQQFLVIDAQAEISYEDRGRTKITRTTDASSADICHTTYRVVSEIERWVHPVTGSLVDFYVWANKPAGTKDWESRMVPDPDKPSY